MSVALTPPSVAPSASPRLGALIQSLEAGLLERDTAVRLLLLAALAGEHVLLIGPPGSAKSELARRLQRCLAGARWFERLLTRFSTPEELFGPLSLKALEDDRYERLTDGYLPTAGVAFLDEVFKANSAILNALLTLLNEREFDNGSGRVRTPLVSLIGASNEGPVEDALQAFYDRFLLRVPVQPVSDEGFAALLLLGTTPAPDVPALTADERAQWCQAAEQVTVGEPLLAALLQTRRWLQGQQIAVSDRRWRQLLRLLRVQVASEGRSALELADLWLLPHAVAPDGDAVPRVAAFVAETLLGVTPVDVTGLTRAVEAFEHQLSLEERLEADDTDDSAGKLSVAKSLAPRDDQSEGGMTRLLSKTLEERRRKRFSPVHVAARVAQLDEVLGGARARLQAAVALGATVQQQLAGRVWLPPSVAASWLGVCQANQAALAGLVARAEQAQRGFAELPLDEQADRRLPPPLSWS